MEKVRILYIEANNDGTIGGSHYSLFYLIEGLDKNIYDPYIIFFQDNILLTKFKNVSKHVMVLDHLSPDSNRLRSFDDIVKFWPRFIRDILWSQIKVGKVLDNIKPDIVHLNNSYKTCHDWVLACKLRGIKIVAHDRGARTPASLQTRFFVRLLDAIICVSDYYLNIVRQQGLKPKFSCRVYNGLNINIFKKACSKEPQLTALRNNFGVKNDDILVGMVGNIDYWKGQLVLVEAIRNILQHTPNIKAIIVGKTVLGGEKYERLIRSFIDQNNLKDNIILAGYREDIATLLSVFDIFVHASIQPEPFGRVIIEAMAMKKPIIATKLGGPSEILVNGENGILVEMNDVSSMENAIMEYVKDMSAAKKNGLNAYAHFINNFSSNQMVVGVENVYQRVLAE